jgi:prolyl oligopeptidase
MFPARARWFRAALAASLAAAPAPIAAQQSPTIHYPATRAVDSATVYHGTAIPDPYRWLEEIDGPDGAAWVQAQNAVTLPYLAVLPGRQALEQRITRLYDYARTGVP